MSTIVINLWSIAYPTITNRIRVDISTQADPLAIVASEIDIVSGHPARIWSFPGLPRTNYLVTMNEIDGGGNPVRNLAYFDVVPGAFQQIFIRDTEQIQVDNTTGLVSGTTGFTLDGTAGTEDWRGWEVTFEEYSGVGTLIKNIDYTWDKTTGVFALIFPGAVLAANQWYTCRFESISAPEAGGSVSGASDFEILLKIEDYTIDAADFGKKIIAEPTGFIMTLTLPSIATVVEGRPIMIETKSDSDFRSVKVVSTLGNTIAFLRGNIYMMLNESLYIYKFNRDGVYEWRVMNAQGNFMYAGQMTSDDATNIFNKVELNGQELNSNRFARYYNEVVLNLPLSQRVAYASWSPANVTLHSLEDSLTHLFHVPDRRNLFERNSSIARVTGSFENFSMEDHQHEQTIGTLPNTIFGTGFTPRILGFYNGVGTRVSDLTSTPFTFHGGLLLPTQTDTETRPTNYSANKYVLV